MSATATAAPTQQPLAGATLWAGALLLSLANFMVVLDMTIANVSVPHIAGGLAVSPSQGTWVITSYSVAEAITVPLTGWLVQRFGSIKIFIAGLIGFGIFSMLCGLAPSFGALVVLRVLQGLCGGPLMPTSQTILLSIFPRQRAGQALGIWSMTVVVGPIAGPLLGGAISDNIGWSWIFFINIPVAAAVAFGVWTVLRDRETPTRRVPVDYVGLGLLVLWVGSLQVMLDRGKELEWFASTTIVILAVIAAIGFCAFLIWELTAENPIVDLKAFRHRGFVMGVITLSLTFGTYFASVVLIPLWLQTSLGYTATWAGYAAAMNGTLAVFMSPVAARMMGKIDPRALVCFGVTWMAGIAFWRAHFNAEVNFWAIALPFLVQGFAMPFFFVPTTTIVLGAVPPQQTASAAGLSNFLRTSSAAFATSIITTGWENTATEKRSQIVGRLNDLTGATDKLARAGLSPEQATAQVDHMVQVQSVMLATNQMFLIMSGLFLLSALVIWLAPRPTPGGSPPGGGH